MAECDSPFLVSLIGTDTDACTLYMMMEAVMGGELFAYLQTRSAALNEAHARFYAASVVLAYEYLHDRQLVYRDLKPENLLIDLQVRLRRLWENMISIQDWPCRGPGRA